MVSRLPRRKIFHVLHPEATFPLVSNNNQPGAQCNSLKRGPIALKISNTSKTKKTSRPKCQRRSSTLSSTRKVHQRSTIRSHLKSRKPQSNSMMILTSLCLTNRTCQTVTRRQTQFIHLTSTGTRIQLACHNHFRGERFMQPNKIMRMHELRIPSRLTRKSPNESQHLSLLPQHQRNLQHPLRLNLPLPLLSDS